MSLSRPAGELSGDHGRESELPLDLFGSEVRLLAGVSVADELSADQALSETAARLTEMHRRLTRFDPGSELSALNANPEDKVACSRYLCLGVESAIEAAERSGGLIDPVVLDALNEVGYAESRADVEPLSLGEAIADAPARRPAAPREDSPWRSISVDLDEGTVTRPAGVALDLGGVGKGLAADIAASNLSGFSSWCADIGGDLRFGGTAGLDREITLVNPVTDETAISFSLSQGAVATSGINRRVWTGPDGPAHHLIDPSTGKPAWTGVVQVTALAGSTQEAETISKMALMLGPEEGSRLLGSGAGGVLVDDSGRSRVLGELAALVDSVDAASSTLRVEA